MTDEPQLPDPEGIDQPSASGLGERELGRRRALARRVQALRDSGPGSGSSEAWLGALRGRLDTTWGRLPLTTRHRIAAAAIVAASVTLILFVLVPAAPCGFPAGDSCPATDDAIGLVPEDALAYVHLDIDDESDQFEAAREIAGRLPMLSQIAIGGLTEVGGVGIDFASQVQPWAGGEAALAVLSSGGPPERVLMIEAEDPTGAEEFASASFGPERSTADVEGAEVSIGRRGLAWALEGGFLMVGSRAGVTSMLDADEFGLAGAEGSSVLGELPDDRFAYAYVSADGARVLFGSRGLEPVGTFVDSDATEGAAAALTADPEGVGLTIRSDLDPERTDDSPGFFAALPTFTPSLTADIGSESLAYLGLADPATSVDALLEQASSTSPGLVAAFEEASRDLAKRSGVDLGSDLLPLLGSEVALSVQPVAAGVTDSAVVPGVVADSATPYVSLIAEGVDPEVAARSLAELQEPVVEALAPTDDGRVATFETIQVAGLEAQSLAVSPAFNLTYATYGDRLVIATDSLGVEEARTLEEGEGLDESNEFRQATSGLPESASLFAFFDIGGLLSLGEQVGLAVDPTYTAFAPELRSLTSAALTVDGGGDAIRTDIRIAVGPPETPQIDTPPLAGE